MAEKIPEGDYEKGKKVFKQRCLQCHVVDSLASKTGPTLNGLIGRKSGTVSGYDYSAANKNKGVVWTRETLFEYLLNPKKVGAGWLGLLGWGESNEKMNFSISPERRWCSPG